MASFIVDVNATAADFDEAGYLAANPDVAAALRDGNLKSGREHFLAFGQAEGRKQRSLSRLKDAKARKFERLRPILRQDMPHVQDEFMFDFLTEDLRKEFNIIDTSAVSSNNYDRYVQEIIARYDDGLILDCGAGCRAIYFDNVVNFEIVAYETTDVRGVGEVLPFKDDSFDAVFSIAVLEHVKDPFRCAREIARVLKPGGELFAAVPFLQPLHGYPHHYYNMTHQGLQNLFADHLKIDRTDCYYSSLPIWSLSWILRSWAGGLPNEAREEFLSLRVADLIGPPEEHMGRSYVTELPFEKNLELASGTTIWAHKPKVSLPAGKA